MTEESKYTPIYAEKIVLADLQNWKKSSNKPISRILDFGCGNGHFTQNFTKLATQVCGCDIDTEKIKSAKKVLGIKFNSISPSEKTKYPSNFFDCVTMMGVLEHVASEEDTLKEIYRILKPGGFLYLYILNKGLFGIFDSGNFKFAFPKLHKLIYFVVFGKQAYRSEFVSKKKKKMLGDFTLGKNWHTHYSLKDVKDLTKERFTIIRHWHYSLMLPLLLIMEFFVVVLFKKRSKILSKIIYLDNKIDAGDLSYSLVVKLKKSK
ncbi:MAG: class I SAM-dependent methyltransferase [Patescibacteria group bacterium]